MDAESQSLTQKRSSGPRVTQAPLLTVALGTFLPLFVAAFVAWALTSKLRVHYPYGMPALGLSPVILCIVLTLIAFGRFRVGKRALGLIAIACSMWIAVLLTAYVTERVYWQYYYTFYGMKDLDTYINIDPANDKGQTYMDAGEVYFKESTYVATTKAVAFQENTIYCVAPIVRQPLENQEGPESVNANGPFTLPASGTVDFWAVGINCCDPSGNGFTCGGVGNPSARAGLRMLRDDVRPFFAMAVQEWTAAMGVPSKHPLFFTWVQDPFFEIENLSFQANRAIGGYFLVLLAGSIVFNFLFQNFLVKLGIP